MALVCGESSKREKANKRRGNMIFVKSTSLKESKKKINATLTLSFSIIHCVKKDSITFSLLHLFIPFEAF